MNKIIKALISFIMVFAFASSIYIVKAEETNINENTEQIENNNGDLDNKNNNGELDNNNENNNGELDNNNEDNGFNLEDIEAQIKENNFVQWVVSLMTAFLGSGAFYMLLKGLANKALSRIKEKLNKELDEAKITKEMYEKRLNVLLDLQAKTEETLNLCNEKIDKMCKMLEEDFAITEEQKQKAREQLELLIGDKNEETNVR